MSENHLEVLREINTKVDALISEYKADVATLLKKESLFG